MPRMLASVMGTGLIPRKHSRKAQIGLVPISRKRCPVLPGRPQSDQVSMPLQIQTCPVLLLEFRYSL